MVAILVGLTFLLVILAELVLRERSFAVSPVRISEARMPAPEVGLFVTPNHLTAEMRPEGLLALAPDPLLRAASGGGLVAARVASSEAEAGEMLLTVGAGSTWIPVEAPFAGRVVAVERERILFAPRDLGEALRRMRVGAEVTGWWRRERARLERFLGSTHCLAEVMPDGGMLEDGFYGSLTRGERAKFRRTFLVGPAA